MQHRMRSLSRNPGFAHVKSVVRMLQAAKVSQLILEAGAFDNMKAEALKDFLASADKASDISFLAIPGFQSYAPQSCQMFGSLKQMKEDFDVDNQCPKAMVKRCLSKGASSGTHFRISNVFRCCLRADSSGAI